MAGYLANLLIRIGVAGTEGVDRELKKASRSVREFGDELTSAGKALSLGITVPLAGIGAAALKAAGELEVAQIAFTTLTKSATVARAHLEELKKLSLETPFTFSDVAQASRLLQGYGFQLDEVIPKIKLIGDTVAALTVSGKGGPDLMERIVRSMGEIGTRGRITGEQMRELARAGIPALDVLSKKLGVTAAEAQRQIAAGYIDAKTASDALFSYMKDRFGGGMMAMSKTLMGQFSNIKDLLLFTFADIGDAILPLTKSIISNFVFPALGAVRLLAKAFKELPSFVQVPAIGAVGTIGITPLAVILAGQFATNISVLAKTWERAKPMLEKGVRWFVEGFTQGAAAANAGMLTLIATTKIFLGLGFAASIGAIVYALKQWADAEGAIIDARETAKASMETLEKKLRAAGVDVDKVKAQFTKSADSIGSVGDAYTAVNMDLQMASGSFSKGKLDVEGYTAELRKLALQLGKVKIETGALRQTPDFASIFDLSGQRPQQDILEQLESLRKKRQELLDQLARQKFPTVPLPTFKQGEGKIFTVYPEDIQRLDLVIKDLEKVAGLSMEVDKAQYKASKRFFDTAEGIRLAAEATAYYTKQKQEMVDAIVASERAQRLETEAARYQFAMAVRDVTGVEFIKIPKIGPEVAFLIDAREGLKRLKVDMTDATQAHQVLKDATDAMAASQEEFNRKTRAAAAPMERYAAALRLIGREGTEDRFEQLRAGFPAIAQGITRNVGTDQQRGAIQNFLRYAREMQIAAREAGHAAGPEFALNLERLTGALETATQAEERFAKQALDGSTEALKRRAAAAKALYVQMLNDENYTYTDRIRQFAVYLEETLRMERDHLQQVSGEEKKATKDRIRNLEDLQRKNDRVLSKMEGDTRSRTRAMTGFWRSFGTQVSTILTDLSRNLVDLLFPRDQKSSRDVDAMKQLGIATGLTGDELEKLTQTIEALAMATGQNFAGLAEAGAATFQAFGTQVSDQIPLLQRLFLIARDSKVSLKDMLDAIVKNAPALKAMGLSAIDAAAMYGRLSLAGENAGTIFDGLTKAYQKIAEMGYSKPGEALADIIQKIRTAGTVADANRIAIEYFGDAGVEMARIIRAGSLDVQEFATDLRDAAQALSEAAEKAKELQKDTSKLGEIFKELERAIIRAVVEAGIKSLVDWIKNSKTLKNVWDDIVGVFKKLTDWLGITHKAAKTATDSLSELNDIIKKIPVGQIPTGPTTTPPNVPGPPGSGGGTGGGGTGSGGTGGGWESAYQTADIFLSAFNTGFNTIMQSKQLGVLEAISKNTAIMSGQLQLAYQAQMAQAEASSQFGQAAPNWFLSVLSPISQMVRSLFGDLSQFIPSPPPFSGTDASDPQQWAEYMKQVAAFYEANPPDLTGKFASNSIFGKMFTKMEDTNKLLRGISDILSNSRDVLVDGIYAELLKLSGATPVTSDTAAKPATTAAGASESTLQDFKKLVGEYIGEMRTLHLPRIEDVLGAGKASGIFQVAQETAGYLRAIHEKDFPRLIGGKTSDVKTNELSTMSVRTESFDLSTQQITRLAKAIESFSTEPVGDTETPFPFRLPVPIVDNLRPISGLGSSVRMPNVSTSTVSNRGGDVYINIDGRSLSSSNQGREIARQLLSFSRSHGLRYRPEVPVASR